MGDADQREGYKVFVGGLSLDTTNQSLSDYFSQYGELTDCVVMREGATRRSRGFGFVKYITSADRETCLSGKPHIVDGKTVETKKAVPKEQSHSSSSQTVKTRKVFLGGLPPEATKDDIILAFESNGGLLDAQIMTEKYSEKPRGFGFAIFKDYSDVDRLLEQKHYRIKDRDVEVKRAVSKDAMVRTDNRSWHGNDAPYGGHVQEPYGGRFQGGIEYPQFPGSRRGGYMGGGGASYYEPERMPPLTASYPSTGGYGVGVGTAGVAGAAVGAGGGYGRPYQPGGYGQGYEMSPMYGAGVYGQGHAAPLMGAYNQNASSYGPSPSRDKPQNQAFHPYSRR